MKTLDQKWKKWIPFFATLALLFILTFVLILFSLGPQKGPFLYQIQ